MKYYPMHMHLHSAHEPTASISSHMAHAAELGIHHLWLTEHDVRMGEKKRSLPIFRFPRKKLFGEMPNGAVAGFTKEELSCCELEFEECGENISLKALLDAEGKMRLHFYSKGKNHADPLFAGVTVGLEADISLSEGAEFSVEFTLSAQPPSYELAKIIYVMGKLPENNKPNVLYLPFPERGDDGIYLFPLTRDTDERVGGLDNASSFVDLVMTGGCSGADLHFKSFRFMRELDFEPVRQNQIKLAAELGERYGVTPFVTFEITGAGHHKNCYTTSVPCIDYKALSHNVTQADAIDHVKRHGGIFCYNHPFTEWKNAKLDEEGKLALVDELAREFTENRVFGATLMEVGFPYEKEDFYDRHYLLLWDKLSANGIFITGDGDSDNHHAGADGWTEGNNFVTFTGIPDTEEPSEESFREAFMRGSVWCGDPVRIREMDLTANGAPMGSVFVGEDVKIEFRAKKIATAGSLLRIVNGKRDQITEFSDGECRDSYTLPCLEDISFVRYELRDSEGVLLALSNPVYTVKNENLIYEEAKIRKVTK